MDTFIRKKLRCIFLSIQPKGFCFSPKIREWNEDLAYYQNAQDNFWFGIYYPNVFDQFEFIELKSSFDCYRLTVPEEIGYFEDNELVITAEMGESILLVSAGEYTKEIPITIKREKVNHYFS